MAGGRRTDMGPGRRRKRHACRVHLREPLGQGAIEPGDGLEQDGESGAGCWSKFVPSSRKWVVGSRTERSRRPTGGISTQTLDVLGSNSRGRRRPASGRRGRSGVADRSADRRGVGHRAQPGRRRRARAPIVPSCWPRRCASRQSEREQTGGSAVLSPAHEHCQRNEYPLIRTPAPWKPVSSRSRL